MLLNRLVVEFVAALRYVILNVYRYSSDANPPEIELVATFNSSLVN